MLNILQGRGRTRASLTSSEGLSVLKCQFVEKLRNPALKESLETA